MYGGYNYNIFQTCPSGTQPYIIRAGDTYFSLAQRFNTTVAAIMAANPGVDPK
jgi:LysM repeat protein